MKKIVISGFLLIQSSILFAAGNPVAVGDVLGRDLDQKPIGALGHLGLLASSNNVVQVMNETAYVNVIQNVTVANFKLTTYWGAKAKSSFTWRSPWQKGTFRCDAFVKWLYTQTGNGSLGGSFPNTTFGSSLLTITRT